MRNFLFPSILLLTLFFASCQDDTSDKTAPESIPADSTIIESESVDTLVTTETIQFFNQSGFSGFAKSQASGFDWSKFKLVNVWEEDSMLTASFNPSENFFKTYGSFLKYSPDSSKFIDLDSYNIDISRNKEGKLSGDEMGPDTEVSLIDLETKEKTRLVFVGPSGSVEDGGWLDSANIVLVGIQDNGAGNSKTAVLWKYHLPTNTFYLYELQDPEGSEKIMNNWRKERLKGVTLNRP